MEHHPLNQSLSRSALPVALHVAYLALTMPLCTTLGMEPRKLACVLMRYTVRYAAPMACRILSYYIHGAGRPNISQLPRLATPLRTRGNFRESPHLRDSLSG